MAAETIMVFLFGLCLGSFLNVCIYRLPRDKSLIKPRSFCPHCNKTIYWYDNIPLLSYIILRGRCRNCSGEISLRYPLVELLTALFLVVMYSKYEFSADFLKFSFFFSLLIVLSFIDIDYHAVPAILCFLGILVAFIFSFLATINNVNQGIMENLPIVATFRNTILGFGFAYFFKFLGDGLLSIYLAWRKKDSIEGETESLGLGDVDFMGMVGAFLGWKLVVITFFLAPFIATGYAIFAMIFKRSHLIPYLPYLSLAAFISLVAESQIEKVLHFLGWG